jgi:DNA-binding transcriptional MerR regulator
MTLKDRLTKLTEHKERIKHLRGRHDQRDHNRWPAGYQAQGYIPTGSGKRGGVMASRATGGLSGMTQALTLANRATQTLPRTRPERSPSFPMQGRSVRQARFRRQAALDYGREYRRRHRMKKPTYQLQGEMIPSDMAALRLGEFFTDNADANLFRNPERITQKLKGGTEINLWESVNESMGALIQRLEDRMRDQGFSEEDIEQATVQYSEAVTNRFEGMMRKAAASYAMDIQGFVGGEIYGNTDDQFHAAKKLAGQGNTMMQIQEASMQAIHNTLKGLPAYEKADDSFKIFLNSVMRPDELDYVVNDFGAAERDASPINQRRMAFTNPALVDDIIQRRIESPSGAPKNTPRTRNELNRYENVIYDEDLPLSDTTTLTTPLRALLPLLHPSIRTQIEGVLKSKDARYPSSENPGDALKATNLRTVDKSTMDAIKATQDLIDSLHTDGGIADTTVESSSDERALGWYSAHRGAFQMARLGDQGTPIIANNPLAGYDPATVKHPQAMAALVMAHEFGHLIDATALPLNEKNWRDYVRFTNAVGEAGGVPSDMPSKASMAAPILRIIDAYQQDVLPRIQSILPSLIQRGFNIGSIMQLVSYLSQPSEIFARAYAQMAGRKMLQRLQAKDKIAGMKLDSDQDYADAIETVTNALSDIGNLVPQNFTDSQFASVEQDITELFSIMGWKLK